MINANEFLTHLGDMAKGKAKEELSNPSAFVRLGTVTNATGRPQIKFDGEDTATTRRYPYADSYTPVVNDRVLLLRSGSTWVVMCKVV